MIDYERRCKLVLERLVALRAQARWEEEHGSLVRWRVALDDVIAKMEGEDDLGERNRMITTMELLDRAHAVLSLERRQERLQLKSRIAAFLREG